MKQGNGVHCSGYQDYASNVFDGMSLKAKQLPLFLHQRNENFASHLQVGATNYFASHFQRWARRLSSYPDRSRERSPHAPAGITWGGRGPGPERPVTPPRIYLHGGAPGLVGRVDRPGCLSPCAGSRHSGRVHGATGEASFGRLRGYLHLPLPVCLQVAIANCKLQSSVPSPQAEHAWKEFLRQPLELESSRGIE